MIAPCDLVDKSLYLFVNINTGGKRNTLTRGCFQQGHWQKDQASYKNCIYGTVF